MTLLRDKIYSNMFSCQHFAPWSTSRPTVSTSAVWPRPASGQCPWQCSGEKSRDDPHQPLPRGFLRGRTPSGRCWEATPTGLGAASVPCQLENCISISKATPRSPLVSANTGMCGVHKGLPRCLSHAGTPLCPIKDGNLVMALTRERCSAVRCS